jgi:hypothetical protein
VSLRSFNFIFCEDQGRDLSASEGEKRHAIPLVELRGLPVFGGLSASGGEFLWASCVFIPGVTGTTLMAVYECIKLQLTDYSALFIQSPCVSFSNFLMIFSITALRLFSSRLSGPL